MNPISVLPNADISSQGTISKLLMQKGLQTFQDACGYVKAMSYGTNAEVSDSCILFEDGYGNCFTKHGAIARLAEELNLPVYKNLGFYRLNDEIVTGINSILAPYGLSFIPQIHCFLEYGNYRVDLTEGNCHGKNKTIEDYDFVIRIQPDITRDQKKQYYTEYLKRYREIAPEFEEMDDVAIFNLLEICDQRTKYQCSIMANEATVAAQ